MMITHLPFVLLAVFLLIVPCCVVGFASPLLVKTSFWNSGSRVILRNSNREEDRDSIIARNNARTDVKTFLTQRAIQSFMFMLISCRDPHSCKWIEDFLDVPGLHEYHGTGAFNITRYGTWDAVLLDMVMQPKEQIIISAKRRGRGHGGWSKNNPYLPERWVEFPIDINPKSLVSRILSVRNQISQEFVDDLGIIVSTSDQILDSYFSKVQSDRDEEKKESNPKDLASAFDRLAMSILNNNMEYEVGESSPFRKGNFDLLCNLCTQSSIHQLLREWQEAGEQKQVSFEWLRNFYVDRVADYFDGDQPYGRADDFIEELLQTPPSMIDTSDGMVGLIDPLGTAENIVRKRGMVARQWKGLLSETPADHMEIQRAILGQMMDPSTGNIDDSAEGAFE